MKLNLIVPFAPTLNSYYTHMKRGIYISKGGSAYRSKVIESVNEQLPGITIDYPVKVDVILFPPDRRKRDIDNYIKALFDAITHSGLWTDDSLVDQLLIKRGDVIKKGAILLEIDSAGAICSADMISQ